MASVTAASDVTDGPVLTLINKRIRNLKKKLNRIAQLEESIAQGKSSIKNKEQEDLLKSKPSIVAAVDELEKFRQPLCVAVDEEISLAIKHSQVGTSESNGKEVDGDNLGETETLANDEKDLAPAIEFLEDLLKLIYFGNMFDVKSQNDFSSIMLTRTHERNCCLTYDYMTDDDAAVMLEDSDLDLISMMSSLLISRPVDSSFSHQNALQRCIEHTKLWLAKSEQPIVDSNSTVTYAALREKLTKIIGSDFFKITPEMKATDVVAGEAAGNYAFQVPVQVESSVTPHEQMHARKFFILLEDVFKNNHHILGSPCDDDFWTKFSVELSKLARMYLSPELCNRFCYTFSSYYSMVKDPTYDKQAQFSHFDELKIESFRKCLESIYGDHADKFICVPETPPSSSSFKRSYDISEASFSLAPDSNLSPEVDAQVQLILDGMSRAGLLNVLDINFAQDWLKNCPWAAGAFIRVQNDFARQNMICSARAEVSQAWVEKKMKRMH